MQDPIADMLTGIRNGQMAGKAEITMPSSKIKTAIANILHEEGYLGEYKIIGSDKKPELNITLKYYEQKPVISKIERVSRVSLRTYKGVGQLPKVLGGLGLAIISTSKGMMTDKKARSLGLGGEVICIVS